MQCYKHINNNAVGICKYCSKGLCMECAKNTPSGLFCAEHINFLQIENLKSMHVTKVKKSNADDILILFVFVVCVSLVALLVFLLN